MTDTKYPDSGRTIANIVSTIALVVALASGAYWAYTLGRDGWIFWIVLATVAGLAVYRGYAKRKG